ncbi:NlpC/P60 family protein [Rhodococcus hoagii]|jgi:cell wall-associated NlpC family hydrolase|uniref:NlpC/P60 family protein n=3 Tax=Rhodococcus hoagii TaxID=43767 RepID=E9T6T9_RHOHA|nr:C40 family peptidase [Prescottella equi]MBU4616962.1 C40 family peptidase [Rhodococcus sp. GG48]MCD7049741.1 C40 family peptidase [Rhodococcus sp. BH2-1]GBF13383.1 putative endopeptidase precursor [Rhodococcus sp. Br-6]AVP69130.1 NlpC/P60 family protein [Prescottella equi]EGD21894.1 NlpC/P60 family protein [Prescottella equi ATCC 33707]
MALKNTRLTRTTRGLLLGAVAAGAVMIPAAPAMAQPFTAPSWGSSSIEATPVAGSNQAVANAAQSKVGSPYVWGATGPSSFDCSGLVQWAYKQAGKSVPRTSYDQVGGGTSVSKANLQPGDVVAFYGAEHVGIYIGNGSVVHAPTEGENVKISPLDSMTFSGASRY